MIGLGPGTDSPRTQFRYFYRIGRELYNGLHEEPYLFSEIEHGERFPKERTLVVPVKPDESDVLLTRPKQQTRSL